MPDPDVFTPNKDTPAVVDKITDPANVTSPEAALADQLAAIKNAEGNPKYDSVPKALDALAQSQLHITTLEAEASVRTAELTTLREQEAKNDVVQDVMDRIAAQNVNQQAQDTPQPNVVDEAAVIALVKNALTVDRAQVQLQENVATVQEAMVARYGDKAAQEMTDKAAALGCTVDHLKTLASESPALVLALFSGGPGSTNNPTSTSLTLNHQPLARPELKPPEKSLLIGASGKDQQEYMQLIRDDVYAKHNVET